MIGADGLWTGHWPELPRGGVTHVVGRAGAGKSKFAATTVENAAAGGTAAALVRLTPGTSWLAVVADCAHMLSVDPQPVGGLAAVLAEAASNSETGRALLVLDDYRHWPTSARPSALVEQVAAIPNVAVVTVSLPQAVGMPTAATRTLGPLPAAAYSDLGAAGDATGGWPHAVEAMRKVVSEHGVACPDSSARMAALLDQRRRKVQGIPGTAGALYLWAVAELSEGRDTPVRVADVAARLERTLVSLSPVRAVLLRTGVLYSPARGTVRFSDPHHVAWVHSEQRTIRKEGG